MELMIAALLIISLIGGGAEEVAVENEINNYTEAPAEYFEEIQQSADKIISSEENITTATQLLLTLKEPKEKAQIGIYEIIDKTGQFTELGSSVVTQGATEMLLTALIRSNQFEVLDRVSFSHFMNEQNLVTQQRTAENAGPEIGFIIGADYIISGAITEYQIDKKTGGLGLLLGGKGGQQEYAVASCAIDLRVTDTTSGRVIWAKSLKKEIIGKKVSFQVFSFMGNNIVEFESGRGKQEVINLVVRTLLEEAVYKLAVSNSL